MRIISFTMVNNESEIIESFIRYNINFVDKMIIIDNGCTDNTIEIVLNLIQEGLDIEIYDESLEPYNQFSIDNRYLNIIIKKYSPDIVIPLDADEFLCSNGNVRTILENLPLDKITYVNWHWYVLDQDVNTEEPFIPRRLINRFERVPWNYSDGKPVTKVIIPALLVKNNNLKLNMGHHSVYGRNEIEKNIIHDLWLSHYRAISANQIVYKTECYTLRDICTMSNNSETAQRTNQMAEIERGTDQSRAAIINSYGGYSGDIICDPINLKYCSAKTSSIKYESLSHESNEFRLLNTGREIAIRAYNLELTKSLRYRSNDNIIFALDGTKGNECIFPNPSNKLTLLMELFPTVGLISTCDKVCFLKANYKLIINPKFSKFLPHSKIVIPPTLDYSSTKKELIIHGIKENNIVSLNYYWKMLPIYKKIGYLITFVPYITARMIKYINRNGLRQTLKKVRGR